MSENEFEIIGEISIDNPIEKPKKPIMAKKNLRKKREDLKEAVNIKKMQAHFYDLLKLMLKAGGKIYDLEKRLKKENISPDKIGEKELISKIREIRIFIKGIGSFEKLSTKEQAEVTLQMRKKAEDLMKYLDKDNK